ncbi:LysR substrate-binding domain-containing protein [Bradyrhizobium japonicum]|uniref:LysR substrate-binding domain-containing protein n=1 Tax=Bradyrhizobium japonicum TaxID=375 RepID=UPI001E3C5F70|nr:LysR substrate-binding domain-containing protein [Bradyrhizobium japonicum]MCD9825480.1 LysR substrate-binding domain-containing protein [Bradyrhizobium japonicum]MCD9898432.1 LysR substrate-binding domain-containing protein [Bradyrhizobium japonicum]MEB2671227.1 LysR substrate-binding domain-containing protein [Bradyrhizobium japonicum]WLB33743.1 LysR substrate-binding domain-containing protein [Bradyrhizobium japonicum]WRI94182.1 LysR substrate-binding domain-containing protein [Bradyrhiz
MNASLSAGNLRATLLDHRHRFPEVDTYLVDGSSDNLISELANSAIDVAVVAEPNPRWSDRSLTVWSERVVAALPENHPLTRRDVLHWGELRREPLLSSQARPGTGVPQAPYQQNGIFRSLPVASPQYRARPASHLGWRWLGYPARIGKCDWRYLSWRHLPRGVRCRGSDAAEFPRLLATGQQQSIAASIS